MTEIERVIATLEELRERLCAYWAPGITTEPCDCKYANIGIASRPLGTGETTGCPELREAIAALLVIADRQSVEGRLWALDAEARQTPAGELMRVDPRNVIALVAIARGEAEVEW